MKNSGPDRDRTGRPRHRGVATVAHALAFKGGVRRSRGRRARARAWRATPRRDRTDLGRVRRTAARLRTTEALSGLESVPAMAPTTRAQAPLGGGPSPGFAAALALAERRRGTALGESLASARPSRHRWGGGTLRSASAPNGSDGPGRNWKGVREHDGASAGRASPNRRRRRVAAEAKAGRAGGVATVRTRWWGTRRLVVGAAGRGWGGAAAGWCVSMRRGGRGAERRARLSCAGGALSAGPWDESPGAGSCAGREHACG